MKNLKSILFVAILSLFSSYASAQSSPKVIVVLNHASWCSICKANGTRAFEVFEENNKDNSFKIIANDISDEKSRSIAKADIKTTGLEKTPQQAYSAGVLSFYDAKTKKLLAQVSVAHTSEEIAKTMDYAKSLASN
jgi:thiol-disulfide isomerase/thioredoxin